MPKLNGTYLPDRLRKRIAELEAGEEVDAKDIRAVLTVEQLAILDAEWKKQQELRKGKRATTEEQQRELGWKSKREVRLEIFKEALLQAEQNLPNAFEDEMRKSEVRQMRIYMDAYSAAIDGGYYKTQAEDMANNALTRAGLARLDRRLANSSSKRDKEIFELEELIKKQLAINTKQEGVEEEITDSVKRKGKKKS